MRRIVLTINLVVLVMLGVSSSAFASSIEGFAEGRTDKAYSGVDDAVPLLSTFYFRFEKVGGAVDHHINSVMVMPAGAAEDMSPDAGLPMPNVESGKIALMYQDKNADDKYFYKVSHYTRSLSGVRRFNVRDVGCTGKCERLLPPPADPGSVFVLIGFQLFFTGSRDHHVDEIAVFEEEGKLIVMLNDKNDDDVFGYSIDYTWISPRVIIRTGEHSGFDRGGARVALPPGRKVIRGFHFNFDKKDHHLREIGALTSNQNLEVYYADKNGDDLFQWKVRWGIIGPLTTLKQTSGKLNFLRVHDVGTRYGPPTDQINVEAVIKLNSKPGYAFGFQLRNDQNRPVRQGMLDLLRDAFNNNWNVTIDYEIANDNKNGIIRRIWLTK